jgi:hypothetical protein
MSYQERKTIVSLISGIYWWLRRIVSMPLDDTSQVQWMPAT